MKGKNPLNTLVSLSRGNVHRCCANNSASSSRNICVLLVVVCMAVYSSHRFAAHKMNSVTLYKSPINGIERECEKPKYNLMIDAAKSNNNNKNAIVDPKKICITTLTDAKNADTLQRLVRWRNFGSLLEMTWPNKQAYAKKHGYSLFDESDSLDTSRPPSWSKIRAAQRLLNEEDCEWVVWLDADTVVMNSNKRIEDFLPSDKDMLITEQKGGSYNAGAWIIKKSEWSLQFLDHWWNMNKFVHPKGMSTSGDNAALKSYLVDTMDKAEFEAHIGVPPRCTFNSVTVFLTADEYEMVKYKPRQEQEWYMHHEKYHKGDLIAHVAGKNNKIDTTAMLLEDAV